MFIRTKYVKGKPYGYLVENEWKKGRTRQKVKKYLGRIYPVNPQPDPDVEFSNPSETIHAIIQQELSEHEFTINSDKGTVRKNNNKAVIAINGGYLCDHTLQQLRDALKSPDLPEQPGGYLAQAFSDAGLRIPPQIFIQLYLEVKK